MERGYLWDAAPYIVIDPKVDQLYFPNYEYGFAGSALSCGAAAAALSSDLCDGTRLSSS